MIELPAGRLTVQRPKAGALLLSAQDEAGPWRSDECFRMLVIVNLGIVGISGCWFVGSGKVTYQDQVPWLAGSIVSACVLVVGLVYWLVCGFRQVNLLQRDAALVLVPWVAAQRGPLPFPDVLEAEGTQDLLVVTAGMHRAHRTGCQLARGKNGLEKVPLADLANRGLAQCGMCQP